MVSKESERTQLIRSILVPQSQLINVGCSERSIREYDLLLRPGPALGSGLRH